MNPTEALREKVKSLCSWDRRFCPEGFVRAVALHDAELDRAISEALSSARADAIRECAQRLRVMGGDEVQAWGGSTVPAEAYFLAANACLALLSGPSSAAPSTPQLPPVQSASPPPPPVGLSAADAPKDPNALQISASGAFRFAPSGVADFRATITKSPQYRCAKHGIVTENISCSIPTYENRFCTRCWVEWLKANIQPVVPVKPAPEAGKEGA